MSGTYVSTDDAIEGANPHWNDLGPRPWVHEWRNHVPEDVQAIWHTFTREQRKALVEWADELAGREEWE
jgi:hypothetical protein